MPDLPPGIYEDLVTEDLHRRLRLVDPSLVDRASLDPGDAYEVLGRHLGEMARRALRSVSGDDAAALVRQVELANQIAEAISLLAPDSASRDDLVAESRDVLQAIVTASQVPGPARFPARPEIPLSTSALLVNGRNQPRIGVEVQRELASADRVDLLCAFVKWHGLRVLEDQLEALIRRGGTFRVITTTYIGATERRAVDRLVQLGAEVKVSYETRMTRLHAKAWLFHRHTGYSTAYVGSSNLSKAALLDGLEWNVRLSTVEQGHLLDTFRATFDEYWEDPAFEPYNPSDPAQRRRLDEALAAERSGPTDLPIEITTLDVRPWGYQREILDELTVERDIHGRHRNLVVMATGTGKTIVAGLDYRRLRESGPVDSLLFVAHRDEILGQSLSTFRHIMRDGSFGERFVGGERPTEWRHVFASVQSLARLDLERELAPDRFDMVIVDEFHHASKETKTYATLLHHLRPKVLLGLTATPERADGLDVLGWFGGRIAVELRLWEALERGLLAPFQYFGVHDETDLQTVRWKRGTGYDTAQLTNIYTGHHARTRIVLQALRDKVTDVGRMRALGFCVSVDHAEFMAARFNEAGIPAQAVTSRSPTDARKAGLAALKSRDVKILFTVDLFNEGVDVPEIDTVLFLRPTESATVFLQQLGRGLRLADDKSCLTVLDFIGNQAAEFRFDLRYRALTGVSRRGLAREIEHGFPTLPPGCHIELDRVAADLVMRNVASSLRIDWKGLVSELRRLGDIDLQTFLAETGLELEDVYRRRHGGWAGLRRLADLDDRPPGPDDDKLVAAIGRMLHIDDLERLAFLGQLLSRAGPPPSFELRGRAGRLLAMLHFSLWSWNEPLDQLDAGLRRLWSNPARQQELLELTQVLRDRIRRTTQAVTPAGDLPLQVHARYSLAELLAAFGVPNPAASRGSGVKWIEAEQADVFWFNLRKTEKHFSPTTMYADRAISPTLFQWESQNATSEASKTGQRYIHHRDAGSSVHLFFRESKEGDGDLGAPAYLYAGPAIYVSHTGERPMRILWKLDHDLPADVFHAARVWRPGDCWRDSVRERCGIARHPPGWPRRLPPKRETRGVTDGSATASGFAEQLLALVDEGRRTATYKLALLLALVDGVAEGVNEAGESPEALHTRVIARHVARLYWPQLRPFPSESGVVDLRQITNKKATILTALREAYVRHPSRTWDEAETAEPEESGRALDAVEVTVARYPLLRLQTIDGAPRPFIYDVAWNESVSLAALHRPSGGQVQFRPGVASQLIQLAPLVRPLVELHWVRMVAQLNGLTPVEDSLRAHMFGADRVAFGSVLRGGLRELQQSDCFYCHERLSQSEAIDHFLPWSRCWPNDAVENLVAAHERCNGKKSDHIAGLVPLRAWGERFASQSGELAELARRTRMLYRPSRTLALARSLYGHLTPGAPLWDGPSLVSEVDDPADLLSVLVGLDP